jgi:hypothetical protein
MAAVVIAVEARFKGVGAGMMPVMPVRLVALCVKENQLPAELPPVRPALE